MVVGDVMLDSYWKGESTRISPEAPVPIVHVESIEERLGGAANVALNLSALGMEVSLFGLIGNDKAGGIIKRKINESKITDCLKKTNKQTINKIRVIAKNQQVIRTDFESQYENNDIDNLYDGIVDEIPFVDVVILSDYNKGILINAKKIIDQCIRHNKLVLIDPKGNNFIKYKGATVITPNKKELREIIGQWSDEEDLYNKAQKLRKELKLEKLLLTRSEEGMSLFDECCCINISSTVKEVYDVSGAGDTAIAVLGMMLANEVNWIDSVRFANKAAGIVVGKFGTATVTTEELGVEIENKKTS